MEKKNTLVVTVKIDAEEAISQLRELEKMLDRVIQKQKQAAE